MSTSTPIPYDVTGNIIAFEGGELDNNETLTLFAYLVKTGMAWQLQGSYGRLAVNLIEKGYISTEGEVLLTV